MILWPCHHFQCLHLQNELVAFRRSLQNANFPSQTRLDNAPLPLDSLSLGPGLIQLEEELNIDGDRLRLSENKIRRLENELRKRDHKIMELGHALQEKRLECQRLHSVILKGAAPNMGPLDDQILAEFRWIRYSILKICRTHYQATSISLPRIQIDPPTTAERQYRWLGTWNEMRVELRDYHVQGCMFDILDRFMFSRRLYGTNVEVEDLLGEFEYCMEDCGESKSKSLKMQLCRVTKFQTTVSLSDRVEWRRRTVNAAQIFKATNLESTADMRAAKEILETLEPALTHRNLPTNYPRAEKLQRDVKDLCNQALQHTITLRSTKAVFQVFSPERGELVAEEDPEMELVAIDGDQSSLRNKVQSTVFGGLVKLTLNAEDAVEPPLVLEKAYVVGCAVSQ